jgi:hypothetical protein
MAALNVWAGGGAVDDENTGSKLQGEYAALQDPRLVMPEVAAVLAELHDAITEFGNALGGAGLPAPVWRLDDARLRPLDKRLPDVTLDDLLTRAAEFAAGIGPYWLHGGAPEIEQLVDETALLAGVFRPLRVIAQRLRMLPARERGALAIERALGEGRVGAKLDRVVRCLADLEALGPFMAPLTREEWAAARGGMPASLADADQFTQPLPPELIPSPSDPPPQLSEAPGTSIAASPVATLLSGAVAPAARQVGQRARQATMTLGGYATRARVRLERVEPRRWVVVGATTLLLALGIGLLAIAAHPGASTTIAPPAPLTVTPATVKLACTGKTSSTTLTLEWTGTASTNWSASVPSGLALSTSRGTLKPNTGIRITLRVTARKAARGTLTFVAGTQRASVVYTVTCG